jgi:hypothetical protein
MDTVKKLHQAPQESKDRFYKLLDVTKPPKPTPTKQSEEYMKILDERK